MHILIHRFFVNFKKIVDFKAFRRCSILWITYETCTKTEDKPVYKALIYI